MINKKVRHSIIMILICLIWIPGSYAQQTTDSLRGRHLYNPHRLGARDTIYAPAQPAGQTIQAEDSLQLLRLQFIQDSILVREQFIRDSLLAREQFVRDSLQRRQRMLDSVSFLQRELPGLMDAYLKTIKEDIIIHENEISIVGDSALSDYSYVFLLFNLTQPYKPWKVSYGLSGDHIKIIADRDRQKIISVQAPFMNCSFTYGNPGYILVINELNMIQHDRSGYFYKVPVDSVFFDRFKRVIKIKRYVHFYSVVNNNQRGAYLFLNLSQVKQYEYGTDNQIRKFQVVNFCERYKAYEASKVCNIITYEFAKQGNTYLLTRRNDPANSYSDGTFTFEFDSRYNMKSLSFRNLSNTENWQRMVELNAEGNVNCYVDKKKEMVSQSLCMIYHTEPGAKYPVETITTIFEEDGISYYQRNNTTGLSRVRDRMTMEWSGWK
jgi:hypothetical protein